MPSQGYSPEDIPDSTRLREERFAVGQEVLRCMTDPPENQTRLAEKMCIGEQMIAMNRGGRTR